MKNDVTQREDYYENTEINSSDNFNKKPSHNKFEKTPEEKLKGARVNLAITWFIVLLLVCSIVVYIAYAFLIDKDDQVLLKEDNHGSVHLYSLNDYRGSVYQTEEEAGLAELTFYLNQVKQDNEDNGDESLFLLSGNSFNGTLESDSNDGELVGKAFNEMNISYSAIGAHEFDYFTFDNYIDSMYKIEGISNMQFLSANLQQENGDLLPFADPYAIEKLNIPGLGVINIGLLGLTSQEILKTGNPDVVKHLRAEDVSTTAATYVPQMQEEGADIIIALTDIPITQDGTEINSLTSVDGIDAVFGANFDNVVNTTINDVPVVQSLSSGKGISEVIIDITKETDKFNLEVKTNVDTFTNKISVGDMTKKNDFVNQEILDYTDSIKSVSNNIFLNTDFDLTNNYDNLETVTQLGALLSDLAISSFINQSKSVSIPFLNDSILLSDILEIIPIISVFNNESTCATLTKGNVNGSQLYSAIPFGGDISLLMLTGEQIYELFEVGLSFNAMEKETKAADLIQYDYGVKVIGDKSGYDNDSSLGEGDTVQTIKVLDSKVRLDNPSISSEELNNEDAYVDIERDESKYFVLTNSFISHGGGNYGDIILENNVLYDFGLNTFELIVHELDPDIPLSKSDVTIPYYYDEDVASYRNRYIQE